MVEDGVLRAWLRAVHPALACTFMAGPGGMMSATAALAWPSTVSCPVQQVMADMESVQLELITVLVTALGFAHPFATTYQSGSPLASRSLLMPIVFHGRRPTAGRVQFPGASPSFPVPILAADSGQRNAPGFFSPL